MAVVVYQGTVVLGMLPGGNAKLPDISYSGVVRARVARPKNRRKTMFWGKQQQKRVKDKNKTNERDLPPKKTLDTQCSEV